MNKYSFTDIYIGMQESFGVTVDSEKMDMFLAISGDNNPLHTDFSYAQNRGFRDVVVYGLLTSSFYSTLVGVYLPGRYCLLQGIDIQFTKPVFTGDKLTVTGKVHFINEAFKYIEIKASITNQEGVKVSKATIRVGLTDE